MKRSIVSVAAALALFGMAAPASAQQAQSQGASSSMAGPLQPGGGIAGASGAMSGGWSRYPQSQGMGDMPGMSMQGTTPTLRRPTWRR